MWVLDLLQSRGLEQYSGLNTIIEYLTNYTCKGGEHYLVWSDTMKSLLKAYTDKGNGDSNLRLLVCSIIMNTVSKQKSPPRTKYSYTLSGGIFKR